MGQGEGMKNIKFEYKDFLNLGEHEHCKFCWHKFMKNPNGQKDCSNQGYCSTDGKYWVCEECYDDFKLLFNWKLVDYKK